MCWRSYLRFPLLSQPSPLWTIVPNLDLVCVWSIETLALAVCVTDFVLHSEKKTQFLQQRRPSHNLIPIPHQDEKEQIILKPTFLPQTSPDHLCIDILKKGDFAKLVVSMFQNCCYIRHVEWVSTFDEIRFWRIRIQHQILLNNTSLRCLPQYKSTLDPSACWVGPNKFGGLRPYV